MFAEKRKNRRRNLHYGARILISPEQFLDCNLSNISEATAHIKAPNTGALPDRFVHELAARGPVRRECEVAWRKPNHVGRNFVTAAAAPAKRLAAPTEPAAENTAATERRAEPEHADQD